MNKTEIKALIAANAAKTIENRKDYFGRPDINRHFDYRDRSLRIQTRALHIALAYLTYKPFSSVEKYNYATRPEHLSNSVWAERYGDQLAALRKANEILGHVETITLSGRVVTRPARNEEFEEWLKGSSRQALEQEAA